MKPMILLTGASASGKTEVAKLLRLKYGIVKAITETTREPRKGEQDGIDYYFVDQKRFQEDWEAGRLVEHTFYNGNSYGCPKKEVTHKKCIVVDPNGLRSFIALKDQSVVTFYLEAREDTREERMRHRGDAPENIIRRIQGDRIDFAPSNIAPTDFHIPTDERGLEEIADDIYVKYVLTLESRHLGTITLPQ
jgi:guanylate kinase